MYKRRITQWGWQKRKRHNSVAATKRNDLPQNDSVKTSSRSMTRQEETEHSTENRTPIRENETHTTPATTAVAVPPPPATGISLAIPYCPKDPHSLRVPNALLQTIRNYVLGSLEAGVFVMSTESTRLVQCITSSKPDGDHLTNLKEVLFLHYAACSLIDQGSFSEARAVLDKAFTKVNKIVLAEHPETIGTILTLVLYLRARKRPEISRLLLTQLANIARVYHSTEHPLIRVCQVFVSLDAGQCDQLMALFHKLTHNLLHSVGTECYYCYRSQENKGRAFAMLTSNTYGNHYPANPVGSRSQWSSLLRESLGYVGKFDMAGRIALLFLSDHCGGCSLDKLPQCQNDLPHATCQWPQCATETRMNPGP
ncbi:MAG: hypothetical protein Q9160_000585 [Pyrenula sp. 1 TL-2023]